MGLSCHDIARLLSEKRDHGLSWRTRLTLRYHLFMCKMCRIYGTQIAAVSRVCQEAGKYSDEKCPGELSAARKQQMKDACSKGK